MLIINNRNLAAFRKYAMENYIERMHLHIGMLYPEFFYFHEKDEVSAFIEETILRAGKYGLSEEYAVTRFMDYRLLLGHEFEFLIENRWILAILNDENYPELDKIATIDRIQFAYITQR